MKNPFSLYGTKPESFIRRHLLEDEILEGITNGQQPKACFLTGIRGIGKTTYLTWFAEYFRKQEDWFVIDLNVYRDMVLASLGFFQLKNIQADQWQNISFNASGVLAESGQDNNGNNVNNGSNDNRDANDTTDYAKMLEVILEKLTSESKHILFTIDEVSFTEHVIAFVCQFEIWCKRNLNVYLLMAGLDENISDLLQEKSLAFLNRTPRVYLTELNLRRIEQMYQKHLSVPSDTAKEMVRATLGYPYAYQVLGCLCYRDNIPWQQALPELDAILEDSLFDKLWSELSKEEREVLAAFHDDGKIKAEEICKRCHMTPVQFSVYTKHLIQKGFIQVPEHGYLQISLPRFIEYVKNHFDA